MQRPRDNQRNRRRCQIPPVRWFWDEDERSMRHGQDQLSGENLVAGTGSVFQVKQRLYLQ